MYGPFANGAKFNLTNNYRDKFHDWSDKQAIDHTSDGKRIEAPPIYMSNIEPRDTNNAPAKAVRHRGQASYTTSNGTKAFDDLDNAGNAVTIDTTVDQTVDVTLP